MPLPTAPERVRASEVLSLDAARARRDAVPDVDVSRRPTFVPVSLLDGSAFERAEDDAALAWSVVAELRRLASHEAQLDLALGRGLARMRASHGHRELGHSRQSDFAPARYGFSWSHARELMDLARRLDSLPACRKAFLAGGITRGKLRLLARVATAEDERRWLQVARDHGLRALEEAVAEHRAGCAGGACTSPPPASPPDVADDGPLVRVRWRTTLLEAAGWEGWGREMLRVIVGRQGPDWMLAEALAADALSRWGWGDDFELPAETSSGALPGATMKPRAIPAAWRRRLRALAKRGDSGQKQPRPLELPDLDACTDAWQLHAALAHVVALRHGLAYERSRLLFLARAHGIPRALGLRSMGDLMDALGLSPRDVAHDLRLQARLVDLPSCAHAWREALLPARTVALLAEVATPATEQAWVDWAMRTPPKRLRLEAEWHLTMRASSDEYLERTRGLPRPDLPTEAFVLDWQAFFGIQRRDRRTAGDADAGGACTSGSDLPSKQTLRARCQAQVTFLAPPEAAAVIEHALDRARRVLGAHLDDGECVRAMLLQLAEDVREMRIRVWRRWRRVVDRVGWLCQAPHCTSRVRFEVHHRRYRSHGGGDEPGNLVVLCAGCHRLVHDGWLSILGRAPDRLCFRVHDREGEIREVHARGEVRSAAA